MAMRSLAKQLLHCSTQHARSAIGSPLRLRSTRSNFPPLSKFLSSSTETPKPFSVEEGVAEINSVEDAADQLKPTEGGEAVADINSIEDAVQLSAERSGTKNLAASDAAPRVANLPKDLTPEQLRLLAQESVEEEKEESELVKRLEREKELVYPTLVKLADVAKKNAVPLADAVREVKANSRARFDETLEAHVRLGIDPRRSDQTVRGAATLPHGTGKAVRVAVFAEGAAAEEAESAGADVVGADELVAEIQESGGKLNFDKCIATPSFMPKLGKVARILGPRGLMPNPKVGTVTTNIGEAVRAAKQGRVDFRADKSGIVHAGLGKVSFKDEALIENIAAFTGALLAAKPTGLKKASRYAGYVNSFTITSTMSQGVRVSLPSLVQAADNFSKSGVKMDRT